jgi:hypothetical protein
MPVLIFQEHAAGKTFGIASDGTTISFYTFSKFMEASYRRFNVSGKGQLVGDDSLPFNFYGLESPDINGDSEIVFASGFPSQQRDIYRSRTNQPFAEAFIGVGEFPHISDGPGSEIVYLKNSIDITHWSDEEPSQWVDLGLWADLNGTGAAATIIYECVKDGYSQICKAKPVNDCAKPTISPTPGSSVLAGAGWLLTYAVTPKDGLKVSDVSIGGRYMAKAMRVPSCDQVGCQSRDVLLVRLRMRLVCKSRMKTSSFF